MVHLMRMLHVVGATIWVGAAVFIAMFLVPTSKALGPVAGPVMGHLTNVRKMPQFLLTIGLVTVLSGYWFYWHNSVVYGKEWMATPPAMVFGVGAVFGTIGWLVGFFFSRPLAQKLGSVLARVAATGAPATPEMLNEIRSAQGKLANAAITVAVLLVLSAICMSVARYT